MGWQGVCYGLASGGGMGWQGVCHGLAGKGSKGSQWEGMRTGQ